MLRRFRAEPAIPPAANDILLPDLVDKIMYTDEAQFKLNGMVNRWNQVYWDNVNRHHALPQELNAPGLMVLVGISSRGLFGPIFF
jgi:hypothetical protein